MKADSPDPRFAASAVARLSSIEFWERYSYFTVFALLALFASAPAARGGLGWSSAASLRFFGVYLLVVQASPVVGGYVADRWMGKRLALRLGAAALSAGHLLLAVSASSPWLAPRSLVSPLFYAAVGLIALGNGLFKPILTVVIGRLPFADEPSRNAAFTTFFLYINIGGLLSVLLGGWLAQRFGWSYAFGASALGMLVAIATMIALDRTYIRPFLGHGPEPRESAGEAAPSPSFAAPVLILLGLVVVCASFSYQSYGFVALFTAQHVARTVGGLTIPPAWFTALNPITIMVLTPILLAFWRRGGLGARWTEVQRLAAGLITMAVGFLPLVGAALQARGGALASPFWLAAAIMLIAVSELLYSPAALAAATRVAPRRAQTLAVGSQGAATGIGGWLSGQLGALAFEYDKALVMGLIAALALVVGLAIFRARALFARFRL